MRIHIKVFCSECESEDPKIVTLFVREQYCGRECLAEGQLKYCRLILRVNAERIENG